MEKGKQFDIHAAGMLALDVSRVEAGLLLIEVDYTSSKKALIPSQKYSPYELGFGKMVHLDKENFIGKRALARDAKNGVARQLVGLEVDWVEVEEQFDKFGLSPAAPSQASRVAVPVYSGDGQVGKATTTAFSPLLKKLIALASVLVRWHRLILGLAILGWGGFAFGRLEFRSGLPGDGEYGCRGWARTDHWAAVAFGEYGRNSHGVYRDLDRNNTQCEPWRAGTKLGPGGNCGH